MQKPKHSLIPRILLALLLGLSPLSSLTLDTPTARAEGEITIENCTDLQNVGSHVVDFPLDGDYILTKDIDCSDTHPLDQDFDDQGEWGDATGFNPIGTFGGGEFTGTFDGQGYAVMDLYINKPLVSFTGLFGATLNANISNLKILDATITGDDFVGGLIGSAANSDITNAHTINIDITGVNSVGGLIGETIETTGTVTKSSSSGEVTGTNIFAGGLIADNEGIINNSYSTATVTSDQAAGGLVAISREDSNISNSFSTGLITSDLDDGGLVAILQAGTVTNSFWDTQTSGLQVSDGGTGKTTAQLNQIENFTDETTAGLDTAWDFILNPNDDVANNEIWNINPLVNDGYPYIIETVSISDCDELQAIGNDFANDLSSNYVLANNIDCDIEPYNDNAGFAPLANDDIPFTGILNGNGFNIVGLFINLPNANKTALIAEASGGLVKDLGLEDVNITGGDTYTAGLIAHNAFFIVDDVYPGADINYTYVTGTINGHEAVGGILGLSSTHDINNSYFDGTIAVERADAPDGLDATGGLTGLAEAITVTDSYAIVEITTDNVGKSGGLIGSDYESTINDSYATGSITGIFDNNFRANTEMGGLIGETFNGNITDSYSSVTISGDHNLGGLIGRNSGTAISNSYATGDITGTANTIGGLVGENLGGAIDTSYATGDLEGNSTIGGLVGAHSLLQVDQEPDQIEEINNSFYQGNITATSEAGGLVGELNDGELNNTYSVATITANGENIGGLIGINSDEENNTITNSYWNTTVSGQAESAGGTGQTTTQMKKLSTYTDWNFEEIWGLNAQENSGYPFLRFQELAHNPPSENSGGGGGGGGGGGAPKPKTSETTGLTYEQEVLEVMSEKIVTENPTAESNKCEVLVMMSRVFDWQVKSGTTNFTDVPAWCTNYAAYGVENEIIEGRTPTTLGLDSPVSRYEVAVMLYRELVRQKRTFTGTTSANFTDTLVAWADQAVKALAKENVIKGFADGTFGGQKGILKQDLGVMLLRTTR